MAKGDYQAGTRRRRSAVVLLRSAGPEITVRTERVRLTLAVADEPVAPVGDMVTCAANAATMARAVIGGEVTECVLAIFLDARQRVTGYAELARGRSTRLG